MMVSTLSWTMPATGGPTVIGREKRASSEPMAWLAPLGPHRSKAMGPIRVTKQPSKSPRRPQRPRRSSYFWWPAWGARVNSIVQTPRMRRDSCQAIEIVF